MAQREALLVKREENAEAQPTGEALRDEISALENRIQSLQDFRQNLMNKQMAELDLVNFGDKSLYFGGSNSNFGQQLAEISTNIECMKTDTLNL